MSDEEHAGASGADLAEEARRFAEAVQQWARRTLPAPPSGHTGPECQWCPLCQFASVLRGEHPEVTERVAEAGAALANAFRAVVESAAQHAPPQHPASPAEADHHRPTPHPGPSGAGDSPRVQRIRLTDPGERSAEQPTEEA